MITYRRVTSAQDADFDDLYRIYATSLTPREQKPRSLMEKMPEQPAYLLLLQVEDGEPAGMSALYTPKGAGFSLLEYLAVDKTRRSSGLGAAIFKESVEQALQDQPEAPLVLEVDSLTGIPGEIEDQNIRRQAFYRKLGCKRIEGLEYILPLPGEGPVAPMGIWVWYRGETPESLPRDTIEGWLRAIYTQVYDCPPDDPRIEQMLAPLPENAALVD